LRFVHIIIWRQESFPFAHGISLKLVSTVCDHLIYIHVALGPASSLPDHQRKLVVMFTFQDLITYSRYKISFFNRQCSQLTVGIGCSLFKICKAVDDLQWHASRCSDLKVVAGTLCLGTP